MSRPEKLGISLRATCEGIGALVAAIHDGRLESYPAPTALHPAKVYHTPSFVQGRAPDSPESKPYTASHLSVLFGNYQKRGRKAHEIVYLALLLMELRELDVLSESDMEEIFNGDSSFTQTALKGLLARTKTEYWNITAQQLATEILSQQ